MKHPCLGIEDKAKHCTRGAEFDAPLRLWTTQVRCGLWKAAVPLTRSYLYHETDVHDFAL